MFLASNKYFMTAAIIFGCCILSRNVFADKIDLIRVVAVNKFPCTFKITEQQLNQLSWALENKNRTHDMDLAVQYNDMHIEIYRALTRLYCAQLLRIGTMDAYDHFVAAQLESGVAQPLQADSFMSFSKHIQLLSVDNYELVETAIILTSVNFAPLTAQDIAVNENDTLDFLAYTLRCSSDIYPIINSTFNKKLFYILFPPHTNFRHMLYTEGGIGMFNYLRDMIAYNYITKKELDLWYAFWIVNISGFRGHINNNGSIYLTEPVANAVGYLKSLIYKMLDNPTYDPLVPYLEYRARHIGYEHLPRDERLFLAHLACLLRLYNTADGQRLYNSVNSLPIDLRTEVMQNFYNGLQDSTHMSATYVPALFGNALYITNGNIEKVIFKILPMYNNMLLQHKKNKSKQTTLCCNDVSAIKNLALLLQP